MSYFVIIMKANLKKWDFSCHFKTAVTVSHHICRGTEFQAVGLEMEKARLDCLV